MSQAQLLPAEHFSPSVFLSNSRPATTSIDIADHFGKQHKDVLKSIRNLYAELPEDVRERNFALTSRTVAGPNNSERQEEFFIVYFDGFILLVMGYTGKKALQIKLLYIAAFNAMRDELAAQREAALPEVSVHNITEDIISAADAPLTPDQQCTLQAIVKAKVEGIPAEQRGKGLYPQIWSRFNNHFRLGSYKQLPQRRMSEAVTYLTRMEVTPKALPAGKPQHLFDRLGLSPYEKVLMGPQVRAMLDSEGEVGPRTLECILLKARYVQVIDEVSRSCSCAGARKEPLPRSQFTHLLAFCVSSMRDEVLGIAPAKAETAIVAMAYSLLDVPPRWYLSTCDAMAALMALVTPLMLHVTFSLPPSKLTVPETSPPKAIVTGEANFFAVWAVLAVAASYTASSSSPLSALPLRFTSMRCQADQAPLSVNRILTWPVSLSTASSIFSEALLTTIPSSMTAILLKKRTICGVQIARAYERGSGP